MQGKLYTEQEITELLAEATRRLSQNMVDDTGDAQLAMVATLIGARIACELKGILKEEKEKTR